MGMRLATLISFVLQASAVATVTAVAIGSIVYALPRSCSAVVAGGIIYQNCSGTWYQPQYASTQVTYVVVNPPY
jgi:hypothetical protein